ncbi:MAG: response regulator receiver protein [Pedosphaera sp.]|nr:response regulator receiver protein [Pedosphaera sp.]
MNAAKEFYSILLADDSEDDRFFMRTALRNHPRLQIVGEVENGEEVMFYFQGTGKYADRQAYPLPDLLLLDLKMPRFTGFEVLLWLQKQDLPDLKVVVLSGSHLKTDNEQAMNLGADAYYTKAVSKPEQEKMVNDLEALLDGSPGNP